MNEDLSINPINAEKFTVQGILNGHLATSGKRFRPELFKRLGKLLGLHPQQFQHICEASELIHNATLIHDDVVDEAKMRRGRPTLNAKMTNAQAVLAGDFLLASVISDLVDLEKFSDLKTLSKTLEEIVEGELLQDSLKNKPSISYDDLEKVSLKKTAALLSWGCEAVARAHSRNDDLALSCKKLGQKIGLAYQMTDDNLDFSLASGKAYAKDLKEGLINFTTLNLIELYPELLYPIFQIRGTSFHENPWQPRQIEHAISETKKQADALFEEALGMIDEISHSINSTDSESQQELKDFVEKIQMRQL